MVPTLDFCRWSVLDYLYKEKGKNMVEVTVMEIDTREVHEVRVVTEVEANAIVKAYAGDPFYTVITRTV